MSLTDDEYTCLLIMKDGENLIRMKNTRWYAPIGTLHTKDMVKPLAGYVDNFVITQKGTHALVEHEQGIEAGVRQLINQQGAINANRTMVHDKMWAAVAALSEAADLAAKTMGTSKQDALRSIAHEVLQRALDKVA